MEEMFLHLLVADDFITVNCVCEKSAVYMDHIAKHIPLLPCHTKTVLALRKHAGRQ